MGTPIGDMIRRARVAAGLTLEDVATRVGVTPGALSHIESGRRLPYPQNAARIAEVLSLDAEEILSALDEAHSDRRQAAVYEDRSMRASMSAPSAPSAAPRSNAYYRETQSVDGLDVERHAGFAAPMPSPAPSLRQSARWSPDSSERMRALDGLAGTAAEAIRTLRGLLDDDDPTVAREARRLLRELDVRLPEE
jgi:transcriptional regulator with XRE-family HTH domain